MAHEAKRQQWIRKYIEEHLSASVVDAAFHDGYDAAFPGYARNLKLWGASPVYQAQRDLAMLESCGILERNRQSLGGSGLTGQGFPNWFWDYSIPAIK